MEKADFERAYAWLADAPLIIDESQIDRFHDAIIAPASRIGSSTVEFGKENVALASAETEVKGKLGMPLAGSEASAKVSGELSDTRSKTTSVVFETIRTPQRQLIQIVWHYEGKYPDRALAVSDPSEAALRDLANTVKAPRLLVFLDLPSQADAEARNLPAAKFIPMAAEFEDKKVVPLHPKLQADNGDGPPLYKELPQDSEYRTKRREYWSWFHNHFSATKAMELIEAETAAHGRIQWIDFRVPISATGDTMHVHLVPDGKYDTGVIAYRLIKRGFRHGTRLVGTLQSGPDLHVLAVYDK